jgi:hypothetical protein
MVPRDQTTMALRRIAMTTTSTVLIGRHTMHALQPGDHGKINCLLVRWTPTGRSKNPSALAAKHGIA